MYFFTLMTRSENIIIVLYYLIINVNSQDADETVSFIFGIVPVNCSGEEFEDGLSVFPSNEHVRFYIFGNNISENTNLGISKQMNCENTILSPLKLQIVANTKKYCAIISLTTPATEESLLHKVRYYLCVKEDASIWKYPGVDDRIAFYVYKPISIPVAVNIILIIVCFLISSLMSGLNIGLMALDPHELTMLKNSGSKKEKKFAKAIYSVRRNGNYLLCSILITATLCNSVATVSIDSFVSSWVAVFVTTSVIVLLCEILPQSICTYFPLYIGYYTIYVTKACMIITAPVSYPLSKILNLILGKEIAAAVTKERLKELLKVTLLPANEERIIAGTLGLSLKKVEDVMTMIEDIFKLPITAIMDFETIALILDSGYSRIPIYVRDKSNIQYVLFTKDLALLDPADKVPVKVLVQNSKYVSTYLPLGTTLDEVLKLFKDSRGHMAFVVGNGVLADDKLKSVVGLVTFEDIIEEIFQAEINDETDTFTDNRSKIRLSKHLESNSWFSLFLNQSTQTSAPSENLKLAAFHFLSEIDVFSSKLISPKSLLALLNMDIYYLALGEKLPQDSIYVQGVPAEYFVMILEGGMELRIGNENLKFEAGPFKYFGIDSLKIDSTENFIPDYTLLAVKKTLYIKISHIQYNAAVLATKFERTKELPDINIKSELYKTFRQIVGPKSLTPSEKN